MKINKVIHHNQWYWGESYMICIDNGNGIVNMQISDDDNERGCISGLSVYSECRHKGLGNTLLIECIKLAKLLKLKEVYLTAEKGSFTFDWYKRHGFVKDKYNNKYLYRLRKKID